MTRLQQMSTAKVHIKGPAFRQIDETAKARANAVTACPDGRLAKASLSVKCLKLKALASPPTEQATTANDIFENFAGEHGKKHCSKYVLNAQAKADQDRPDTPFSRGD